MTNLKNKTGGIQRTQEISVRREKESSSGKEGSGEGSRPGGKVRKRKGLRKGGRSSSGKEDEKDYRRGEDLGGHVPGSKGRGHGELTRFTKQMNE